MTSKETIAYLNDLRIKNNVSFSEIEETIAQNENQISKVTECLEKDDNYSKEVMKYIFELLNNNVEEVISYYYQSCIDSDNTCNNGKLKTQKTETFWKDEHSAIVFIISSFFHNPVFFTKAWNLNAIINWKISKIKNQEEELDDFYIPKAASSADKGYKDKVIPGVGKMYMYYDEDYEELTLRIIVDEENLNKKFKVSQKIQYAETGKIFEIYFESNGQKTIAGKPRPNQNPSHGIRYFGKPKVTFE